MPLWPGTGIPYGKSPFAFSMGTPEARTTVMVGATFSSRTRFVGCSSGVGDASAGFMFRELGRREARLFFFSEGFGVGRGWKAFDIDWPTFLKKSPTGSACTHGPLNKNSASAGMKIQREQIKDLIAMRFNVKAGFSATIGTYEKQKIALRGDFRLFIRMNNATEAIAADHRPIPQIFRNNLHLEC